jgi:hypothetical protein
MLHTTAQDLSEKEKERERERKRERERETLFLHRPSGLQDITHYKCLIFMILWFGGVQGSNMCSFILISIMLKKVLTQGNPNTGACAWENSRCESERERERELYNALVLHFASFTVNFALLASRYRLAGVSRLSMQSQQVNYCDGQSALTAIWL